VRLTLLLTSPRVAPGLLTRDAWDALASGDQVLCTDPGEPLPRAVAATGLSVDVLPVASADALLAAVGPGHLVWLASDEEASRLPAELASAIVTAGERGRELPEVEVLHGSYDVPGARLLDLVAVMDRLRTDCPWDREQTHRSLARYLLEETYETLEAIDTGDETHLREELGDLLLQVVFHARVASESSDAGFDIDDVAGGIVDKLVHRHPHVFAGLDVADRDEVEANWETLKAAEKGRASVLEGIPAALPALALADKVLGRAAKVDVTAAPQEEALGGQLLALVVRAREAGLDPEQELRDAVRGLADAVRAAESDG
jgi:NTP pyrophosphatase (non-canonical NTP hydrolase)